MKASLLTVLSILFGLTVLFRAVSVYSGGLPDEVPEVSGASEVDPADQSEVRALLTAGGDADVAECLTGPVYAQAQDEMQRLSERRIEIDERETALAALEARMKAQLDAVEAANAELEQKLASLEGVANEDIAHLVSMYQTMKPKQAADIFNSMDPAFAAGFLRQMRSDAAGLIMANIDADKSYEISVIIANRNSSYREVSQ